MTRCKFLIALLFTFLTFCCNADMFQFQRFEQLARCFLQFCITGLKNKKNTGKSLGGFAVDKSFSTPIFEL